MKTYRLSPRALVVAVAAVGAMIAPAGAAFADSTPTATPSAGVEDTRKKKAAAAEERWAKASAADKEALRKKGAAAGTVWAPEVRTPRGGVAAGEQPKVSSGGTKSTARPSAKPADRRTPTVAPGAGVTEREQPKVNLGDAKSTARPAVVTPRGGVAAGERPAESGGTTGLLTGSAVAFALVAGAGVLVVRRRASAN
ncbi:hypothetical protein GCM10010232_14490 [Streptomyces amakusaensis]|uniref:Gram-positive cocci surface proteins LPxTG domain-containing protein n=1 Tax=Streptomyces amakusaensis TaxID=67271 RepID=A0ABW0AGC6_9ACTN